MSGVSEPIETETFFRERLGTCVQAQTVAPNNYAVVDLTKAILRVCASRSGSSADQSHVSILDQETKKGALRRVRPWFKRLARSDEYPLGGQRVVVNRSLELRLRLRR